ncbi:MAG: ethylbenzene dehydrogenase-related protein [Candidatus Bipolaricaulia bacterium]
MNRRRWYLAGIVVLLLAAIGLGFASQSQQAGNVLTVVRVTSPPTLDGRMDDLWAQADAIQVPVFAGANMGSTTVALKAVYTDDAIYFLARWQDPTLSLRRFPWQKQEDGSWKQLTTSAEHDENTYYEDKFAILWNIDNSIAGFNQSGCMVACHVGEGKAYGNMRTASEGELGDMWHWKSVRTGPVGQLDDKYLNNTSPSGRHADPKQEGGYSNNVNQAGDRPAFTAASQPVPPYWIYDDEKTPFMDIYQVGDEIAGIIVSPFVGDRGDVKAEAYYEDGLWTLEIGRKLATGSPYDAQFDDLSESYLFGVAVFDNAQVRHAFSGGVYELRFGR